MLEKQGIDPTTNAEFITVPEECPGYLCEKSLPIAHINWVGVDDLIHKIGIEKFGFTIKKGLRNLRYLFYLNPVQIWAVPPFMFKY